MRKNQRRNSIQIVIVMLCVCFAVAILGYILGVTMDELKVQIGNDVESSVGESVRIQFLNETETFTEQSPKENGGLNDAEGGVTEKVTEVFDKIFANDILPILTGLATGLMTVLALLVPYIKTLGKLKSTQSAYATVYDEHEKLIGLAKEFDTENVKKDIIEKVVEEVETKFARYDKALGQVLGQEEIISAQVTALIEGAKLAWKQADGASVVLAKTPTATVVEKQALAIEFLKTMIANELGLKKEVLESKMNKELAK